MPSEFAGGCGSPDIPNRWFRGRSALAEFAQNAGAARREFLVTYTYLDLFDLMSHVPSVPIRVWAAHRDKQLKPLALRRPRDLTDTGRHGLSEYEFDEEWPILACRRLNQGHLYCTGSGDRRFHLFGSSNIPPWAAPI